MIKNYYGGYTALVSHRMLLVVYSIITVLDLTAPHSNMPEDCIAAIEIPNLISAYK